MPSASVVSSARCPGRQPCHLRHDRRQHRAPGLLRRIGRPGRTRRRAAAGRSAVPAGPEPSASKSAGSSDAEDKRGTFLITPCEAHLSCCSGGGSTRPIGAGFAQPANTLGDRIDVDPAEARVPDQLQDQAVGGPGRAATATCGWAATQQSNWQVYKQELRRLSRDQLRARADGGVPHQPRRGPGLKAEDACASGLSHRVQPAGQPAAQLGTG